MPLTCCDPLYAPVAFSKDPPRQPFVIALYPLRGIAYFFTHPSLWKIIICPFIITFLIAITAFIVIFSTLYPQYLLIESLIDINWLSWVIAVIACLCEVAFIVLLSVFIFFDGTKRRIYRKVFEIECVRVKSLDSELTNSTEAMDNCMEENCACWLFADLWDTVKGCIFCCIIDRKDCGWFFLMKVISFIVFLVSLPLNLIPVIGTLAFCAINGTLMAWRLQLNYFKKKRLPPSVCSFILKHRTSEYLAFGTVCMLLDLIPLLDILLIYTNVIGSALWIVDIERSGMYDSNNISLPNQSPLVNVNDSMDEENAPVEYNFY